MVVEIPVTEARAQFAELVNRVGYGGEEIVLTRHGKALVALVPAAALRIHSGATDEIILDLTSTRDPAGTDFGLAAQQGYPPPRANG